MRFISLKVLVPLLCATVYFAGSCSFTKTDALNADIPFAKASYKLDGEVTEESCGVYIFFINFANLFGSDAASVQAGGGGGRGQPVHSVYFPRVTPRRGFLLHRPGHSGFGKPWPGRVGGPPLGQG